MPWPPFWPSQVVSAPTEHETDIIQFGLPILEQGGPSATIDVVFTASGQLLGLDRAIAAADAVVTAEAVGIREMIGRHIDVGSSISGGRFTDRGWQAIRPAAIKWSRQRHNSFVEQVRAEKARAAAEERQLSALARAERDLAKAQTESDEAEAALHGSFTRNSNERRNNARKQLAAAQAKVNEIHSIEYIDKLWSDYHAKRNRGRN